MKTVTRIDLMSHSFVRTFRCNLINRNISQQTMQIQSACLLVFTGCWISKKVLAGDSTDLCCLCDRCGLAASGRGNLKIDASGLTCDLLAVEMADLYAPGDKTCKGLQGKFRPTCCDGDVEVIEVLQPPTPMPSVLYPQGKEPWCDLCKDGSFPALSHTLVAVLYLPEAHTCRDLYYLGRSKNIPDQLCKPMQYFMKEPCGCETEQPPAQKPTSIPTINPPTCAPTSLPIGTSTDQPTLVPTKMKPGEEKCAECMGFLANYADADDSKAAEKECKIISINKVVQKACKKVVKDVLKKGLDELDTCKAYGWCPATSTRALMRAGTTGKCEDEPTSSNPTSNPTNVSTKKPDEEECADCMGFLLNYDDADDSKVAGKECKLMSSNKAVQKACKKVVKDVLKKGKDKLDTCKLYGWCLEL